MIDFMMSPAALTMASEGCWNSLNMTLPAPAISSSTMSNLSASVVSLGGGGGRGREGGGRDGGREGREGEK